MIDPLNRLKMNSCLFSGYYCDLTSICLWGKVKERLLFGRLIGKRIKAKRRPFPFKKGMAAAIFIPICYCCPEQVFTEVCMVI